MPFTKSHQKIGGREKGTPNKETLTKLERRAYFEKKAQEKFDKWIDTIKPEYGLDQFMGKAPTKLDVDMKEEKHELSPAIRKLADLLVAVEKGVYVPADPNYDPIKEVEEKWNDKEGGNE